MKVELKNVKTYPAMSRESACFSATLYIDGRRAASVVGRGTGGSYDIHFPSKSSNPRGQLNLGMADLRERFYKWIDEQPPIDLGEDFGDDRMVPANLEIVIDRLLDKHVNQYLYN